MTFRILSANVACLAIGVGMGWLVFHQNTADEKSDPVASSVAKNENLIAKGASSSETGPSTQSRHSARVYTAAGQAELAKQSGLAKPTKDGGLVVVSSSLLQAMGKRASSLSIEQDLFSRDGKVESALQISDSEKAAVQQAWRGLREGVRKLEVASSTAVDLEDGSVRITVPNVAQDLGDLAQQFRDGVRISLGDNRAQAFLAMKQVGGMFDQQGTESAYTVRMEATGNGRWRYHISSEKGDQRKTWVGESVPSALRHLTDAATINPNLNAQQFDEEDE